MDGLIPVACLMVAFCFGLWLGVEGLYDDSRHPLYQGDFKLATNFCKGDAIYSLTKTSDIHVVCLDGREHTFSVE